MEDRVRKRKRKPKPKPPMAKIIFDSRNGALDREMPVTLAHQLYHEHKLYMDLTNSRPGNMYYSPFEGYEAEIRRICFERSWKKE